MKKLIITSVLSLVAITSLNATEVSLKENTIIFNKTFKKDIENTILTTSVNIQINRNTESQTIKDLDKYKKELSEYKKNIKSMVLNIDKNQEYNKLKRKYDIVGHKAILSFKIEANDFKEIDKISKRLLALKNKDFNTSIRIFNLQWIPNKDKVSKLKEELREEAIAWGMNYQPKHLNDNCYMYQTNINMNNYPTHRQPMYLAKSASMEMASSDIASGMQKGDNQIKLNVNYTLKCKL